MRGPCLGQAEEGAFRGRIALAHDGACPRKKSEPEEGDLRVRKEGDSRHEWGFDAPLSMAGRIGRGPISADM